MNPGLNKNDMLWIIFLVCLAIGCWAIGLITLVR